MRRLYGEYVTIELIGWQGGQPEASAKAGEGSDGSREWDADLSRKLLDASVERYGRY